jgi:Flp pilus assembly pilin Flp
MPRLLIALKKFDRDEEAVSIVEYALLLALIVVVCFAAMSFLGNQIGNLFSSLSTTI